MAKLNIIAIGGAHQFPHFLPVAFEIAARDGFDVVIFVASQDDADRVTELARQLDLVCPPIAMMRVPLLERSGRTRRGMGKIWRLLYWARRLRSADAIICAERTSTILKRLPGTCPPMLHFRHGAGDRAVGFERRIALFDHVLTIGEKDRRRTIADGLVAPNQCHVAGPVKLASIALGPKHPRLFANERPTIVFNPHFHKKYGSFDAIAERFIEAVHADGRYNLIIAPHVRLARPMSPEQIGRCEAMSVEDRIIVDMGSTRSLDMSYIMAADLYVGDVSSQVYEFIAEPRPCLFVNVADVEWREDPDFAMWHFGPVIGREDDLLSAVDHAVESFAIYRPVQAERARDAFGGTWVDTPDADRPALARKIIAKAADLLGSLVNDPCALQSPPTRGTE